MGAREQKHLTRVAELGCALCRHLGHGATPAEIHHPRIGLGGAQRASDWLAIPVCPEHHRLGRDSIHGTKEAWKLANFSEMDALADTIANLAR